MGSEHLRFSSAVMRDSTTEEQKGGDIFEIVSPFHEILPNEAKCCFVDYLLPEFEDLESRVPNPLGPFDRRMETAR
jgi:hypothetical protein